MYLVAAAWLYVTLMMAVAEAAAPNGSLLGAFFTFVLYGALPLSVVLYILATPARKRAGRARERQELEAAARSSAHPPNGGGHAPGGTEDGAVAPVREKP